MNFSFRLFITFTFASFIIFSCGKKNKESELSIQWNIQTDSILHDTSNTLASVDSLRNLVLQSNHDTAAIDALFELSEKLSTTAGQIVIDEAALQSEKLNYAQGLAMSIYRNGYQSFRNRNDLMADSLFRISFIHARKLGFKKIEALSLFRMGEIRRYKSDWDSSNYYLNQAKELALKIEENRLHAYILYMLGEVKRMQHNYEEAIKDYEAAIELAKQVNDYNRLSLCFSVMANIYLVQGNIPLALKTQLQGLEYSKKVENRMSESFALSVLSEIYRLNNQLDEAVKHAKDALSIAQEIKNNYRIGELNSIIGQNYLDQKKPDSALVYYKEAANVSLNTNDLNRNAVSLGALGQIMMELKKPDESRKYLEEALEKSEQINNPGTQAYVLYLFAELSFEEKDYQKALFYGEKALEAATLGEVPEYIKSSAEVLTKTYQLLKQPAEALEKYKLFVEMKDSLLNEEQVRKFASFEYEAKEKELKLEQEKAIQIKTNEIERQKLIKNASFAGLFLVFIIACIATFSFIQKRKDNKIIQKEKEKSEELLLNILPYETAQELKEKGESEARLIDHVTVLFTDFKGFTALAESLTANELVQDLNICFSEFDRIMEKHGIEKIKTIGDAYMAAGGLPVPNTTHAFDVLKAAREIIDFIEAGKQRKIKAGLPFFEIRIGIHTGPVVAGIVGIKKFQYDIWGDTVNTASRMESAGETGKINLSESTYELIKDQIKCTYRGEIEAKGKGKIKMYFVD